MGAGGEGGIRTLGTLAGTTVFETAPIDRSGTSPLCATIVPKPIISAGWGAVTLTAVLLARLFGFCNTEFHAKAVLKRQAGTSAPLALRAGSRGLKIRPQNPP